MKVKFWFFLIILLNILPLQYTYGDKTKNLFLIEYEGNWDNSFINMVLNSFLYFQIKWVWYDSDRPIYNSCMPENA